MLSLDDYYLSREDRVQKAASVHPLYAQRGVPGTHDLDALLADIDALVAGEQQRALPLFDKSTDDRNPEARHIDLTEPAGLLIVEGWCIGALPQTDSELAASINDIEARDDPDGSFRRRVNRATARYRQALATRLDAFWYLRPPAWQQVLEWRWQQECDLPSDRRRLRDPADVAAFLALFQRLSEHMQQLTAPGANAWADLIIPLDDLHRPQLETAHEPA